MIVYFPPMIVYFQSRSYTFSHDRILYHPISNVRCSCRWGTYKRTFLSMNNPGQVIINFPFRPNYKSTCMFSTPQIHLTVALPNFRLELHCFLARMCQRSRNHTSEVYNGLTDLTNRQTRAKNDKQYLKKFSFPVYFRKNFRRKDFSENFYHAKSFVFEF